jgi:serine O-acetyltransferase
MLAVNKIEQILGFIKGNFIHYTLTESEEEREHLLWETEAQLQKLIEISIDHIPASETIPPINFKKIFEEVYQDALFILDEDPAANSLREILFCYPGIHAIFHYRISNLLLKNRVAILPRLISEIAHSNTGIDIHPGAMIESPFMIDHGTGIVIGETSVIGHHVKIFQGVTLGATVVHKKQKHIKRHPTLEDHVTIYAGSTILGGNTIIGRHCIIGGNTHISQSVKPYSIVYHKQQNCIKNLINRQEYARKETDKELTELTDYII